MTRARGHLRLLMRWVAYLGLAAWAIGSVASFAEDSAVLFQRFGALGVAASVLFFTDRLTKIELSRQQSVERLLHEYGLELEVLKSGTDPQDIPAKGYVIDFLTEERNFDRLRGRADWFNAWNTALMTVATLQWGFGDLFLARYVFTTAGAG